MEIMPVEDKEEAPMKTILRMWAILTLETASSCKSQASEISTSAKGLKLKEMMKRNFRSSRTRKPSSTALDTAHP